MMMITMVMIMIVVMMMLNDDDNLDDDSDNNDDDDDDDDDELKASCVICIVSGLWSAMQIWALDYHVPYMLPVITFSFFSALL